MAHDHELILNRYRPIAQAGAGGFGTVQIAWDTRIQRRVAIKCIPLSATQAFRAAQVGAARDAADASGARGETAAAASETARLRDARGGRSGAARPSAGGRAARRRFASSSGTERLSGAFDSVGLADAAEPADPFAVSLEHLPGLDEARTAALLSDPNIVGVYDFEVQGATAYLIMEYVDGITLSTLLRRFGDELSLDTVAAVFSSVAHALEIAHANQVLHLDIKPDNVLIDRQGRVKVTDFGLATLADAAGFGTTGGGTIGYMPLEQMRQESLDARCDEWALASVTYEMLVGRNPFLAPDLERAEAAIEDAELPLPSQYWDDLDPAADDVLFYALDPDREERYDNVADFAEEMERFLGDAVRGRAELVRFVSVACGDEEEGGNDEAPEAHPARRRRGPVEAFGARRVRSAAMRVWAACGTAAAGVLALANIAALDAAPEPTRWVIAALLAVAALVKPSVGALLGLLSLAVALVMGPAPAAGVALGAAAVAWWLFVGRTGDAQAGGALSPVLFGAVGFGQVSPLAAGCFLSTGQACVTTALAFMVSVVLAGFGSETVLWWDFLAHGSFAAVDVQAGMLAVLAAPATWCVGVSWIAAAATASGLASFGRRGLSVLGAACATAVLVAGVCAAMWFDSGFVSVVTDWRALFSTVVVGALATILCGCGATDRALEPGFAEEE